MSEKSTHNARSLNSKKSEYTTLLISNISSRVHPEDARESLEYEFSRFGKCRVDVSKDCLTGDQVAYAVFSSPDNAHKAKTARGVLFMKERKLTIEAVYDTYDNINSCSEKASRRSRSSSFSSEENWKRYDSPNSDKYVRYRSKSIDSLHRFSSKKHSQKNYRKGSDFDFVRNRSGKNDLSLPSTPEKIQCDLDRGQCFENATVEKKFININLKLLEDDPRATRVLFVGNLEPNVTKEQIYKAFNKYGVIEHVDIKEIKDANTTKGSFCFIKFGNLDMAFSAKQALDKKPLIDNIMHIGYGKIIPSIRIWVGGLGSWTRLADIKTAFKTFGNIQKIDYRKGDSCAAITYDSADAAREAVRKMRGFLMPYAQTRLKMDYLDVKSRNFYDFKPLHSAQCWMKSSKSFNNYKNNIAGKTYVLESSKSLTNKYNNFVAKNESLKNDLSAEMQFKHFRAQSCRSLQEFCVAFNPPCWQGGFKLKYVHFPVRFFLLNGDMRTFNVATADPTSPTGKFY